MGFIKLVKLFIYDAAFRTRAWDFVLNELDSSRRLNVSEGLRKAILV